MERAGDEQELGAWSSRHAVGAPHKGFAAAMRVIKARRSAFTGGRPPVGCADSWVQYSRKRRRCHRRTVSGVTISRGAFPSVPVQFHPPTVDRSSDDYLMARLKDPLNPSWPGAGLSMDFNVQVWADHRQPIENALIAWNAKDSPWEKLATIRIPPQVVASTEQAEFCGHLTFNPWHSLAEHEPLGGINRVSRDVMFALQNPQLDAKGLKRFEPTGGESFFPGATFPWRKPPPTSLGKEVFHGIS
jgi:hypothetical protein